MILFHRKYKSGSGFALWRWKDIETNGSLYLRRLHIIQVPKVGTIMLHWIVRPDRARDLHDHPVSFLSLVLRGAYYEHILEERGAYQFETIRYIRRWNFKRATDAHRISDVFGPKGVLTLVFTGPKVREWGFHTDAGWIAWRNYNGEN